MSMGCVHNYNVYEAHKQHQLFTPHNSNSDKQFKKKTTVLNKTLVNHWCQWDTSFIYKILFPILMWEQPTTQLKMRYFTKQCKHIQLDILMG